MIEIVIQVKPGSSANELFTDQNNELVVKLRAKPIDGEANAALVKFLTSALKLRNSEIEIIKGTTSRIKKIRLYITPHDWEKKRELIARKQGR